MARATGTIIDRVHVQADYDRAREFGAANDVRLFYQGAEGERLQRLEAGNVAFALPASRVLSAGIPGSNFGVRAEGRAGRFQLQALWAQSRVESATREFRLGSDGGGATHEVRASVEDADYARGQFFFLFHPRELAAYPHVDLRALRPSDAPAELIPARGIQLYRYTGTPPAQDGSTLMLRAAPRELAQAHESVTGAFLLLRAAVDYHVHTSGRWLVHARPLGEDAALGVSYPTAEGTAIGDVAGGDAPVRQVRLL
ncbi:MAG: hypothetical protein KY444_09295, partial [Gemmatimonadetes bacterium]|nr:hypothetical protein [Gemmatimonadota bacterium]